MQIDSFHRASEAIANPWNAFCCAIRGVTRGFFNRAGASNPADQPECCRAANGSEPSFSLIYAASTPAHPYPYSINCNGENSNKKKKHNIKTRTGYNVGNDNGLVIIECSDQEKVRGIRNRTGNNLGDRNGMIEIRNGNPRRIHGIKNRTGRNVGNENGVIKIGNFRGY